MRIFCRRKFFTAIIFLSFAGMISCRNAGKMNETIPALVQTDSCRMDFAHHYEVYVPEREKTAGKMPMVVILDAHGDGKSALNRFRSGADRWGMILIASDKIKNGYQDYAGAVQTLVDDVREKYPAGETVFVAGFSGGARMALGYALGHPVNGLILCGALAGSEDLQALGCPVLSVSGTDDFNFIETAQYLFNEQTIPGNLKMELTAGSHSWPESRILEKALGFLWFSSCQGEIPSPLRSLLKTYCKAEQTLIDSLKQHEKFLEAELVARNLATTKPFNDKEDFASVYNALKNDPAYLAQLNRLKENLNFELSVRQPYLEAFRTKDTAWWKNEITTAVEKIKTETDPFKRDTYQRIKGFWGIACFSLCKQAIQQHDGKTLNRLLSVYRILEPENPDMFYFSAIACYWKNDEGSTVRLLKKAVQAGFSDREQLKKDFPGSIDRKLW